MDKIDKKILQLLRLNSRIALKEIAKEVYLSEPSIKNRINKLVEQNVIEAFTIKINEKKMGFGVFFIIKLSELKLPFKEFVEIIQQNINISNIYVVTGTENYILKGCTKDIVELEILLSELMGYGKTDTSIILDEINPQRTMM